MQIILGSQSPRRKEILNYFNLPFKQMDPVFDEESVPFHGNPFTYVCQLAQGKANALACSLPSDAILITADTIVFCNGKIYGKPKNKEEAFQSLQELSGKWHQVLTGVAVKKGDSLFTDAEETRVLFHSLSPNQIQKYQSKVHCEDKAGGYAIQNSGSMIVEKIEGAFHNVMGLPIHTLSKLLLKVDIDLWDYL